MGGVGFVERLKEETEGPFGLKLPLNFPYVTHKSHVCDLCQQFCTAIKM